MSGERLNIAGVRKLYPASRVTIWRKIKTGSFPAPHYIGAHRYWFKADVERWLSEQSTSTPQVVNLPAARP